MEADPAASGRNVACVDVDGGVNYFPLTCGTDSEYAPIRDPGKKERKEEWRDYLIMKEELFH